MSIPICFFWGSSFLHSSARLATRMASCIAVVLWFRPSIISVCVRTCQRDQSRNFFKEHEETQHQQSFLNSNTSPCPPNPHSQSSSYSSYPLTFLAMSHPPIPPPPPTNNTTSHNSISVGTNTRNEPKMPSPFKNS